MVDTSDPVEVLRFIHHDLRNLLGSITGYHDELGDHPKRQRFPRSLTTHILLVKKCFKRVNDHFDEFGRHVQALEKDTNGDEKMKELVRSHVMESQLHVDARELVEAAEALHAAYSEFESSHLRYNTPEERREWGKPVDVIRIQSKNLHAAIEDALFQRTTDFDARSLLEGHPKTELYVPDTLIMLHGRQPLLRRVITNLVFNAQDHDSDRIQLILRLRGPHAYIHVVDNGKGIAPNMLENQRLFRKGETTRADGKGLGLAFSKSAVLEHGGTIRAGNNRGGGARFTIRLPVKYVRAG